MTKVSDQYAGVLFQEFMASSAAAFMKGKFPEGALDLRVEQDPIDPTMFHFHYNTEVPLFVGAIPMEPAPSLPHLSLLFPSFGCIEPSDMKVDAGGDDGSKQLRLIDEEKV